MQFTICPKTLNLDANGLWFSDLNEAKEEALDWSVELKGEEVIVYEVIEGNYGYDFKPLTVVCS